MPQFKFIVTESYVAGIRFWSYSLPEYHNILRSHGRIRFGELGVTRVNQVLAEYERIEKVLEEDFLLEEGVGQGLMTLLNSEEKARELLADETFHILWRSRLTTVELRIYSDRRLTTCIISHPVITMRLRHAHHPGATGSHG